MTFMPQVQSSAARRVVISTNLRVSAFWASSGCVVRASLSRRCKMFDHDDRAHVDDAAAPYATRRAEFDDPAGLDRIDDYDPELERVVDSPTVM
jgi:hypothetical protein